jgi:hypothetical protein
MEQNQYIWVLAALHAIVLIILLYGVSTDSDQILNYALGLIFLLMLPVAYLVAKRADVL